MTETFPAPSVGTRGCRKNGASSEPGCSDWSRNGSRWNRWQFRRVALRPTRYYQPFSVKLLKTTHEVYTGTRTASIRREESPGTSPAASNWNARPPVKSVVGHLHEPAAALWGLTFYQHQMDREEVARGGRAASVCSRSSKNPSWIAPYLRHRLRPGRTSGPVPHPTSLDSSASEPPDPFPHVP